MTMPTPGQLVKMQQRDLALLTAQAVAGVVSRLDRIEQLLGKVSDLQGEHAREIGGLHRDIADIRGDSNRAILSASARADQAAADARAAAAATAAIGEQVRKLIAELKQEQERKIAELREDIDAIADDVTVDAVNGERVPLRRVVIRKFDELRTIQDRAYGVLAVFMFVWPFLFKWIERLVWP